MSHYVTYVLVPNEAVDLELPLDEATKFEVPVTRLLAPSYGHLEVGMYRRECECLWHSALNRAMNLPEWKVQGASFVFTRKDFSKPGFELAWRRKVLELGSPDPSCDECGGSGFVVSRGESWLKMGLLGYGCHF